MLLRPSHAWVASHGTSASRARAAAQARGLKIEVADHIILGHSTAANSKGYFSMREMGLFFAAAPA